MIKKQQEEGDYNTKKLRLGIVGTGYLSRIVVDTWKSGLLEEYELAGAFGRNEGTTGKMTVDIGCKACKDVGELLELKPDYIAEAASVAYVKDMAVKVLSAGRNLVVLSIGAFADSEFLEQVKQATRKHGTKMHIAPGAMGGSDVLRTVSLMDQATTGIKTRKGPVSLRNTPLYEEYLMTDTDSTNVFNGNAKEAIALLPTKVNIAVATSLATIRPEHTSVSIHSVPGMVRDDHKITAEIEGVKAVVDVYSSTSAIARWSVVTLLRNLVSPIVL